MEISFQSPLALSQRASETSNFLQFMNVINPVIEFDPGAMQNIDANEIVRWAHGAHNVSPRTLRTREAVQQIRAQDQQQQELAQQAEIAGQLASAGKDAAAGIKDVIGNA